MPRPIEPTPPVPTDEPSDQRRTVSPDAPEQAATFVPGQRYGTSPPASHDSREIGRGGIGRVLLMFDSQLGREVALKELLEPGAENEERFLREARIAGQLEHPNIVPVYELSKRPDGRLYYTMKLVRGRTLRSALREADGLHGRLALLGHFLDLCHAMAYAHSRGVVHRDLKPDNVMVGEFGETVLLDWGLAKVKGSRDSKSSELARRLELIERSPTSTVAGAALGTPAYMSPEQAEGRLDAVDERSDVWGLGAVLYELVTGLPPFHGVSVADVLREVRSEPVRPVREREAKAPVELSAIAEKALQRDPGRRYASARELAADVEAFQNGQRVRAYSYSALDLARGFVARHRALSAALAALLVLLVASSVAVSVAWRRAASEREAALANEARARKALGSSLLEGAAADRLREDPLAARAKVRTALELELSGPGDDAPQSLQARGQWLDLSRWPLRYRVQGDEMLYAAALSPDGRRLAVGGQKGVVHVHELSTGEVRELSGHTHNVLGLGWLPDGRALVSGGGEGSVLLRDLSGGPPRTLLAASGTAYVSRLAVSPDGSLVAASFSDGAVRLLDLARGGARLLGRHQGPAAAGAFLRGGDEVVSVGDDGARRWGLAGGAGTRLAGVDARALGVAVSPASGEIAVGMHDGRLLLANPETDRVRPLFGHAEPVRAVAFDGSGRKLASGGWDGVRLWDVEHLSSTPVPGHSDGVYGLSFGPTGLLATASVDRTARVVDPAALSAVLHGGHADRVHGVDVSPDGELVATSGADRTARLWHAATGLSRLVGRHPEGLIDVRFDRAGERIATGCRDGIVRVWDLKKGTATALRGHESHVEGVDFSPDGRLVAATGWDSTVRLWDLAKAGKEAPRVLRGHEGQVRGLRFSPDGQLLATGGADHTVRLWDVATGKDRVLAGHGDGVYGVRFDGSGRKLVSASADHTARVWDLAGAAPPIVLGDVGTSFWTAVFHPDGAHVAVSSEGSSAQAWAWDEKGSARLERRVGQGEPGSIGIAYGPDGRLAAAGGEGVVGLWDERGEPLWKEPPILPATPACFVWPALSPRSLAAAEEFGFSAALAQRPAGCRAIPEGLAEALRARTSPVRLAPAGKDVAFVVVGASVQLWNLDSGLRVFERAVPGASEARPAGRSSCVALGAGGRATWLGPEGAQTVLAESGATAIGVGDGEVLVGLAGGRVLRFDAAGQPRGAQESRVRGAITAVSGDARRLFVGSSAGEVELLPTGAPPVLFRAGSGKITELVAGPAGTVVAGAGDGRVAVWEPGRSAPLDVTRLHGKVSVLLLDGTRLLATTDRGDWLAQPLEVLAQPSCEVLRKVWREVAVVWADGAVAARPPPPDSPCRP